MERAEVSRVGGRGVIGIKQGSLLRFQKHCKESAFWSGRSLRQDPEGTRGLFESDPVRQLFSDLFLGDSTMRTTHSSSQLIVVDHSFVFGAAQN